MSAETSPDKPTKEQLKEQLDYYDFLFQKGLYQALSPENFPLIPPEKVALARFWAMNNVIDGFSNARQMTEDDNLKGQLGSMATNLIQERDQLLASVLAPAGEVNEDFIRRHTLLMQPNDATRLLEMTLGLGLVDQLSDRNFPALRALTHKEKLMLKLRALDNKKIRLGEMQSALKGLGLGNKADEEKRNRIGQELKATEGLYIQLLDEYLSFES